MRLFVFSAAIGARPEPLPAVEFTDTPHILFTDRPADYRGLGWEIRPAGFGPGTKPSAPSARMMARRIKLSPHGFLPDADASLWIDASLALTTDPRAIAEECLAAGDVWANRHPRRECLYAEADLCAELRRDRPDVLKAQAKAYRAAGYPAGAGLFETGLLLRRHTPDVAAMNRSWQREIDRWSCRDQVSFPYVLWKLGTHCGAFPNGLGCGRAHVIDNGHGRQRLRGWGG